MPNRTLATVNSTGRQAASVARVAAAVGYAVKAHVADRHGPVAQELEGLENVTVVEGSLEDKSFVADFFTGVQRAFINTLSWGDEVAIGKLLADAAKKAGVKHYIYSSMPDHSVFSPEWPSLPLWSVKFTVENYIRQVHRSSFPDTGHRDTKSDRSTYRPPSYTRAFTTTTSLAFLIPSSA